MKFKILAGKHAAHAGTNKVGDIIESPEQLDELFKNKFQQVEDGAKVTKATPTATQVAQTDRPDAEQLAAQKKKEKEEEGEDGEDEDGNDAVKKKGGTKDGGAKDEEEDDDGEDGEDHKDVTKQFSTAHKAGVSVSKAGSSYYVYDTNSANPSTPINVKPLKKGEVASFIKELS